MPYTGGIDLNGYVLDFEGAPSSDYIARLDMVGYGTGSIFELTDSNHERDHGNRFLDPKGNSIKGGIFCNHSGTTDYLIRLTQETTNVRDVTFINNNNKEGIVCTNNMCKNVLIENVNFFYNDIHEARGSGVLNNGSVNVEIKNCWFEGNYNNNCGILRFNEPYDSTASVSLENCLITNNRSYRGAAVYSAVESLSLKNVTITNHINENLYDNSGEFHVGLIYTGYETKKVTYGGTVIIKNNYQTLESGKLEERNTGYFTNNVLEVTLDNFDTVNSNIGIHVKGPLSATSEYQISKLPNMGPYKDAFSSDQGYTIINQDGQLYIKGKNTYNVVLDSNYEGGIKKQITVGQGEHLPVMQAPTRPGCTFVGWYKDAGKNTRWENGTDTVTAATTLYAGWTASNTTHNVTYNVYYDSTDERFVYGEVVVDGNKITVPADPVPPERYMFDGWYTEATYENKWNFDTVPTSDVTLYAKWVEYYTVQVWTNEPFATPIKVKKNEKITPPTAPNVDGYVVVGWYKDSSYNEPWDFETNVVTEDMELYAKYESEFVYGVGGGGQEILLYNKKTNTNNLTAVPEAFRDYVFKGWYTLPIGGELLEATTSVAELKHIYYAHWEKQDGTKIITVPLIIKGEFEDDEETGVFSYATIFTLDEKPSELLDPIDLANYGITFDATTGKATIEDTFFDVYDYRYCLTLIGNVTLEVIGTNTINFTSVLREETIMVGVMVEGEDVIVEGSGSLNIELNGNAIEDSSDESMLAVFGIGAVNFTNKVPIYAKAYGTKGSIYGVYGDCEGVFTNTANINIEFGTDDIAAQSPDSAVGVYMGVEGKVNLNSGKITVDASKLGDDSEIYGIGFMSGEGIYFPLEAEVTVENGTDMSGTEITTIESGTEQALILFEDTSLPLVIKIGGTTTLTGYYGDGKNPITLYDEANEISNLATVPTYKNYVFDGWYTLPAGGEKLTLTEDTVPEGETTVYAQWKTADGRKVLEQTLAIAFENYERLDEMQPFIGVFFYDDNIVFDDLSDLADYGITVDQQTGKVVFDNVVIDIASDISEAYGVYIADDNAEIELKGTNKISINDTWSATGSTGILSYGGGNLKLSGSGKLEMDIRGNKSADDSMAVGVFFLNAEFISEADMSIRASRAKELFGIWSYGDEFANAGNLSIVLGDDGDEDSEACGIDVGKFTYNKGKISIELNNDSAPADKSVAIEWTDGIVSNKTNKVTNAKDNLGKAITAIETFAETSYLVPKTKGSPVVIEVKNTPTPTPDPTPGPSPSPEPEKPAPEEKKEPVEYKVPVKEKNEASVAAVVEDNKAEVGEITDKIINETTGNKKDEAAPLVIDLSQSKNEVTEAVLTSKSIANIVSAIADKKIDGLTVVLNGAAVTLDETAIKSVSKQASGDKINLVVAKTKEGELSNTQQNAVKDLNVQSTFEAYIECNGKRMHEFGGGSVQVSMDYKKPSSQSADFIHVYYIADDGTRERFNTTFKNNKITFTTTHFSDYIIVYDEDDPNENHVEETKINVTPEFGELKAWASLVAGKKLTISWNEIEGADGYEILASKCNSLGQKYKIRNIKTITSGDTTSYTMKSLKKGTFYKFKVRAYKKVNGKKVVIASTTLMHTVTNGGKFDVADYVQITEIGNKTYKLTKKRKANGAEYEYTLKKGASAEISAKEIADGKIAHHVGIRYESSNPEVATVDAEGNITALKKGSCEIYVYAQNGVYACVKLTVKK